MWDSHTQMWTLLSVLGSVAMLVFHLGYTPPHRNHVQRNLKRLYYEITVLFILGSATLTLFEYQHMSFCLDEDNESDQDNADDDDDDDENHDLINDTWGDGVRTGDSDRMDVDQNDTADDYTITKQKLAEIIQKGRSLIKTIRRSQILTMYVNDGRKTFRVNRRLINDCITRWNSTYLSFKSLLEHKPILLNLFENKRKLPISSKQKEKLYGLELSSDDWILLTYLLEIFEPFYQATNLLSGSRYPTIGLSLYAIRQLKEFVEVHDDDRSNIFNTLKDFLRESLNEYFDENDKQFQLLMVSN